MLCNHHRKACVAGTIGFTCSRLDSRAADSHISSAASPGLVNGVDRGLVGSLVSIMGSSLASALASGERHRYRMLLRLCAALVPAGVLSPVTVMAQLEALVQAANNAAGAGGCVMLQMVLCMDLGALLRCCMACLTSPYQLEADAAQILPGMSACPFGAA